MATNQHFEGCVCGRAEWFLDAGEAATAKEISSIECVTVAVQVSEESVLEYFFQKKLNNQVA